MVYFIYCVTGFSRGWLSLLSEFSIKTKTNISIMDFILIAVIVLGAIGLIAAVVLFAASKKFAVYEDPRIAHVGEVLPGANCG